MTMHPALITAARQNLHRELVESGTLTIAETTLGRVASNADRSQATSRRLSLHVAEQLHAHTAVKSAGQTAGAGFERIVADFLRATFPKMQSARPGDWTILNVGSSRRKDHLSAYEPYTHLADLAEAIRLNPEIGASLGNNYVISPDILVLREALPDSTLNRDLKVVDDHSGLLSPVRAANRNSPTQHVHAVISCKWTMRSDRSQNTRAEALNLIRNRKGRSPHIIAVTNEPTMSRIASLALGTGDIDMVYHVALNELMLAIEDEGSDDAKELLETLVHGNRLRDIGDLPLDLSV